MKKTAEEMVKYLEESGMAKRFEELKPGDSFGVEIPIDEDEGRFLQFWLTAEGSSEKVEYLTFDFKGVIRVRVTTDLDKLEKWCLDSGILEIAELAYADHTESEATGV